MILRIISGILLTFAAFMGFKQGWAMLTIQPNMLNLFGKWNLKSTFVLVNGAVTLLGTLLMLYPKTFVWGNFVLAADILLIICFHLSSKDLQSAASELPFFLLNLILIYIQHPLAK